MSTPSTFDTALRHAQAAIAEYAASRSPRNWMCLLAAFDELKRAHAPAAERAAERLARNGRAT